MDQTPYRILSCHCLTFTPVFSPKIPKTPGGWGITSKKRHGDCLLLGNVRGLPPILSTRVKGPECLTLMMLHDSAKVGDSERGLHC